MQVPKPSEPEMRRFRALVPDRPEVVVKAMFGNLGAFVNGNMFMGLYGSSIGLKLPAAAQEQLLAVAGCGPFGPAERPMGGYVRIPDEWDAATAQARLWVSRSLDHVAALPPKPPAARRPKKLAAPGSSG